jgi:hypothetical protein
MTICEVDPTEVDTYLDYSVLKKYRHAGHIKSGEWDLKAAPLSASPKYRLIRQYHAGEIDERDLTYEQLLDSEYPESEALFYTEYGYGRYLDDLFESIQNNGLDNDHALDSENSEDSNRYDHIAINIGRNGNVIFNSCGFHRLVTSQLLGLETVPVRLNTIHRDWWNDQRTIEDQISDHPSIVYVDQLHIPWADISTRKAGE